MRLVLVGAIGLLIGLLAFGGVSILGRLADDREDPDLAAVRTLAVDTLVFEHRMGIPDQSTLSLLAAGDMTALRANAEAAARARYGGPLLATRIRQAIAAVDLQVSGEQSVLDGGAKDIVVGAITIDRDRATVHLRATTWVVMAVPGRPLDNPMSRNNWIFTLDKVAGRWLVTDTESDFRG